MAHKIKPAAKKGTMPKSVFKKGGSTKKKGAMKGCSIKNGCKSKSGGLTAKGRRMINKKTGSKLKAPQPGGGPRKRSFCARNLGQIKKFNIDCRKTPKKRACLARKKWKC